MLWRIHLTCPVEVAQHLAGAIESYGLAVSTYETRDEYIWAVEATAKQKPNQQELQNAVAIAASLLEIDSPTVYVEPLPETDWLEATWKSFPPREIGPFYVYGSHSKALIPDGLIGLEVNAATAFGSGEHETTTGCLLTLAELSKNHQFKHPLDMGCGSGILAMAAAKLWNVPVIAADNDPESVRVTLENAKMNSCYPLVQAFVSEGFADKNVTERGPYDLIMANILAKPLCLMANDMLQNLQVEGRIILSGLLVRQQEEVIAAYERAGGKLAAQRHIHDWATLTISKS
jgi:ribosomal protein L11 methyltransferase